MTEIKQIYKCEICGNIVEVLHNGPGELVCCNEAMKLQSENTVDASNEKHIPVITKDKEEVIVKVGSIEHPMDEDHYIEWIEILTEKGSSKKFLKPDEPSQAVFPVKVENITARAYCNLHGLWKSE